MDVVSGLRSGQRFLADARSRDLGSLGPEQLAAEVAAVQALRREADALNLALVAAADQKDAHRATDAPSLTALVAMESGVTRRDAAREIRLANRIEAAPRVKEAMAKPGMSTAKAAIVTDALDTLPTGLTIEQRDTVEADMVAAAQMMTAEQLRRKARRAVEVVDADRADRIENTGLTRDESGQRQLREFWIGCPDETTGLVPFGGKTDAVTADMLRAVVESKTSPRRRALTETSPEESNLEPREKAGEAFAEIVRHLPRDGYGNHGGVAATLVVTVDEKTLRGETDRAGVTEFGTPVSAGQLRKLACGAGILPVVMNGSSQVLDAGRAKRHHTAAQRVALAQRDQGCAFPQCDRPPGWTEAHHAIPWSQHGETNLETGVLLCSHHHHRVHEAHIAIRFSTDDGTPEFRIKNQWQRNHRYRPLAA
ncbi:MULTISPECIES: HNH endonuclease signature motif containing protein [Aeromicrobium]|uniref:HNH endonuclease signature motif containing protein n=1 Tax=Aeromicrobium TaxID=2040 RepID=UPI002580FAF2|nr:MULTISPECIES: HNH endonuclease signature motif containing protein [Aeromicrobium]